MYILFYLRVYMPLYTLSMQATTKKSSRKNKLKYVTAYIDNLEKKNQIKLICRKKKTSLCIKIDIYLYVKKEIEIIQYIHTRSAMDRTQQLSKTIH